MQFKIKEVEVKEATKNEVLLSDASALEVGIFFGDILVIKQGKIKLNVFALENNLPKGVIGMSKSLIDSHRFIKNKPLKVEVAKQAPSIKFILKKLQGKKLSEKEFFTIVKDINSQAISEAAIAYFVAAIDKHSLTNQETFFLTKAIAYNGDRLKWGSKIIGDKHCVGGIPGNRTTPIIVAICAAAGLKMPKTSSRAITSAAGTADSMEVLANVSLSTDKLKAIADKAGGFLAWGGALGLAPADDLLIHVERQLNLDPMPQIVASILSKKIAAGSTHIIIDIPVGKNAKVSEKEGKILDKLFKIIGDKFNLKIKTILTDGTKPIGQGVGPVLEIIDVLAVLQQTRNISDLESKSIFLAGNLLEITGKAKSGNGEKLARDILKSGQAYRKFQEIINAQGAVKNPNLTPGPLSYSVKASKSGNLLWHNQQINNLAKELGCPEKKRAGIFLNLPQGSKVSKGDIIMTLYAQEKNGLNSGLVFLKNNNIFEIAS